jgi:hypothetical protein
MMLIPVNKTLECAAREEVWNWHLPAIFIMIPPWL